MTRFLLDTNILIRLNDQPSIAQSAIRREISNGLLPTVVPQVLAEYWAVATRPANANGLGLEPSLVAKELTVFQADFRLLCDIPACFSEWISVVSRYDVRGKQTHDARLVGAMIAHGIDRILTFNGQDFVRYGEIAVIAP